jgi:hypothetical protein
MCDVADYEMIWKCRVIDNRDEQMFCVGSLAYDPVKELSPILQTRILD